MLFLVFLLLFKLSISKRIKKNLKTYIFLRWYKIKRIKVFLTNAIIITLSSLLIRSISTIFGVYISNRIGTEMLGIFQLVMSVYFLFITIATSGINLTATRLVSEELAKNNSAGAKKAIKQSLLFSFIVGAIAALILIFSASYISYNWLHNKVSSKPFYYIAIALPLISMSSAINGYFTAVRKVGKTATSQILENIIKIIATIYMLNIFLPRGFEYACLALIIGDFISEVFSFAHIYITYIIDTKKYIGKSEKSYIKPILKITVPVAITSYIRSGLSTLKQMLIPVKLEQANMSCNQALSIYGIINGMVFPILMFPSVLINAFSSLLVPEVATFYAKKDLNKINKIITIVFKVVTMFSILVMGIFLIYSEQISSAIYENTEVGKYLVILAPLIILMYLDNIIDSILKGIDKQVGVMLCNVLDLIVTISFICILLPVQGTKGYICIIYISEILNFTISFIQLKKATKFKIEIFEWVIKPAILVGIAIYITNLLKIQEQNPIWNLIQQISIIAGTYLVLLLISNRKDNGTEVLSSGLQGFQNKKKACQ